MAYGDSFFKFLDDNSIPAYSVKVGDNEPIVFLEGFVVDQLIKDSYAIPVDHGGLIIGKFHTEGGVHVLTPYNNGFKYVCEMEGYEYIVNPTSTIENKEFLNHINYSVNHDKESNPIKFNVPRRIRTIDLRTLKFDLIIIPNGELYITNRTATEKYMDKIDEINDRRMFKKVIRLFGL
jgi:hypothetical protein